MTSKQLSTWGLSLAVAAAALLADGPGVRADSERIPSNRLEGTWRVQVTTHDCTNGTTLLSFPAMLTFAKGGTLTGTTAAPLFKPGQRTPDHGAWVQTGWRQYRAVSEAFILFDSPPPPLPLQKGVQRITQEIEVEHDRFDSDAQVEFKDVSGNVVAHLCATAVGTRFD